ncbi:MAG: sodium-dependent multivitamin transporter 6, partial [Oceanospirillaceae bacterium]
MSSIDWIILVVTLLFITFYGIYKNRGDKDIDGYLLGNKSLPWYHVGFSVMATQASAITFLSAPGQAYTDGMRFVQFYFGLPLAMIVLCVTFVPIFHRLKVYTAYEYLETRFDGRVRVFTALLFLIQRGLSTGISIYAPSLIMSTIFGWEIFWTNILMGGIVLTYTVIGGTKAISHTHLQQMIIMTCSLFFAGYLVVDLLPADMGLFEALQVAGKADKLNVIDFNFDPKEKYNVWSGLLAGFFLQLSYFGTDQSQVSRYLTGSSIKQSRIGLLMNGMLKIPMQFMILMLGAIVFV